MTFKTSEELQTSPTMCCVLHLITGSSCSRKPRMTHRNRLNSTISSKSSPYHSKNPQVRSRILNIYILGIFRRASSASRSEEVSNIETLPTVFENHNMVHPATPGSSLEQSSRPNESCTLCDLPSKATPKTSDGYFLEVGSPVTALCHVTIPG